MMNDDIKKYPIYRVTSGNLIPVYDVNSTDDYNHYVYNLHHFIRRKQYEQNKKWYNDRGLYQKLILLPIPMHEQVHQQAIKNMSDEEFLKVYKISRWELLFNKKFSKYRGIEDGTIHK